VRKPVLFCLAAVLAAGCAGSAKPSSSAAPASSQAPAATPTPTDRQRVNPNIVEDRPTYSIERFKKSEYIRVDATHIRHPIVQRPVEIYKEDAEYYYVYTAKPLREETSAAASAPAKPATSQPPDPNPPSTPGADYGMPPEDFEDLTPARASANFRLEPVANSGLPAVGMWRHTFAVADINGDGIPDVVSPPARLGGQATLRIWFGDGQGHFRDAQLKFTRGGKPQNFTADYGGVAVGDIDGDGRPDVVMAMHSGGIAALFGAGAGEFVISNQGLPGREFSTQAVALVDVNGDGKLDIVASADTYEIGTGGAWEPHQVRVYLSDGARGWKYAPDALVDGAWSNWLATFDYNGDGRMDVVTGSQIYGAVQMLWANQGNGKFATGYFPQIEIHGFHFAMAPGTYGRKRVPAFADAFYRSTNVPARLEAEGISVYSYENGAWTRHRIWRKKAGQSAMYALAMGDIDGDGLDDVLFADTTGPNRLRIFLQQEDGSFKEADEKLEPILDSAGQCVRLVDVDGDGRLDVIVSKSFSSGRSEEQGGWTVFMNRK
jgi:hypothetical protein